MQVAIRECAERGMKRKEALLRLRALFPEGLFSDKDVANELQKFRVSGGVEGQDGEGGVQEVDGAQEEEVMEDVGDAEGEGDEVEAQLQVQLQNQTRLVQGDQHHQQLLQQQQQMQQPTQMLQQSQQIHQQALQQNQQTLQPTQQHQHLFAPGVPAYW